MGNTFGPNGFSIGSSRQVSSSKYPRSYCMKLTSQIRSPDLRHPDVLPGKDVAEIHLAPIEADAAAVE